MEGKLVESLEGSPTGLTQVGKVLIGDKAYMIMSDGDIYEYDFVSKVWSIETTYPGQKNSRFVYFSFNNKIYMGLSIKASTTDMANSMHQDFWSYDLTLGIWNEVEPFPKKLEDGKIFFFFSNSKLYLGHGISMGVKYNNRHKFKLYAFDPNK